MEWMPIPIAPFDRDLRLAVVFRGKAHALVFPARRILGGWVNAQTGDTIEVYPTHWRDWRPTA
jgi:hypothetical protein